MNKTTVSKKILAVIMTVLMLLSTAAICASALTELDTTVDNEKGLITVKKLDGDYTYTIEPNDGVIAGLTLDSKSCQYSGLTAGESYTITVKDNNSEVVGTKTITLKSTQDKPSSIATKVTVSSIKFTKPVSSTAGVYEYSINGGKTYFKDQTEFTDLTPDTDYACCARYAETDTKIAGTPISCNSRTLKAKVTVDTPAPQIKSVTKDTITIVPVDGYEYSCDNGATWQSSNTFTGLKSGTVYALALRYKVDLTEQEPCDMGEVTSVRTNTADVYVATVAKTNAKLKESGDKYVSTGFDISAVVDKRTESNTSTPQWGDTKLVPNSIKNGTTSIAAMNYDSTDKCYYGTVTLDAKGTYTLTVVYNKYEYRGESTEGADSDGYVYVGTETTQISNVVVTAKPTTASKILTFLLNTVPNYIVKGIEWLTNFIAKLKG